MVKIDYYSHRLLFVVQGCEHCRIYKEVVWKYNIKVPIEKQIKIIDCTLFHSYKIREDLLIKKYKKIIDGNYPTLIFDGIKVNGASLKWEVEAILDTLLGNDYILKETNDYVFNKKCEYKKLPIIGRKIVCN